MHDQYPFFCFAKMYGFSVQWLLGFATIFTADQGVMAIPSAVMKNSCSPAGMADTDAHPVRRITIRENMRHLLSGWYRDAGITAPGVVCLEINLK
jgi:hypothetical protein